VGGECESGRNNQDLELIQRQDVLLSLAGEDKFDEAGLILLMVLLSCLSPNQ
jgi:hypothetical protein